MAETLSDEEIEQGLPEGWTHEGNEIVRTFEFEEYLPGVEFLEDVAELAEEEWHHPEMILRYGEVEVRFTTHDAGGVTEKDLDLAEQVNELR